MLVVGRSPPFQGEKKSRIYSRRCLNADMYLVTRRGARVLGLTCYLQLVQYLHIVTVSILSKSWRKILGLRDRFRDAKWLP
jgi:hypothetical protein